MLSSFSTFSCQRLIGIFLLMIASGTSLFSQEKFINRDTIYDPDIHTVILENPYNPNDLPIILLEEYNPLVLRFDEFRSDISIFYVKIEHCNKDWQPSGLFSLEYNDGFEEDEIRQYQFSNTQYQVFNHYFYSFPSRNSSLKPLVSGNYLLHVYRYENEEVPVLTRRFYVVENLANVNVQAQLPMVESPGVGYQELDLEVIWQSNRIKNPMARISIDIFQNGRENIALRGVTPNFLGQKSVKFNYLEKILFSGLRHFRFLDIRTTRVKTYNVRSIQAGEEYVDVLLHTEESRKFQPHFFRRDLNGYFDIENLDSPNNPHTNAEYVRVLFSYLEPNYHPGNELHVIGKFNDFRMDSTSIMDYHYETQTFTKKMLLKQGFYNYLYAYKDPVTGKAVTTETEGGRFETHNLYTILVYYRSPVGRHDELIGYLSFETNIYE